MKNPVFVFILVTFLILIDFYIFHVLKSMLNGVSGGVKTAVSYGYWFLCIASLSAFLLFPFIVNPYFRQYIFSIGIGWVIAQIILVVFFLVDDLRRGAFWTLGQVASTAGAKFMNTEQGIPRSAFLNWLGVGVLLPYFFRYYMVLVINTSTNYCKKKWQLKIYLLHLRALKLFI